MQMAVDMNELGHSIYLNLSLKSRSKWLNYVNVDDELGSDKDNVRNETLM